MNALKLRPCAHCSVCSHYEPGCTAQRCRRRAGTAAQSRCWSDTQMTAHRPAHRPASSVRADPRCSKVCTACCCSCKVALTLQPCDASQLGTRHTQETKYCSFQPPTPWANPTSAILSADCPAPRWPPEGAGAPAPAALPAAAPSPEACWPVAGPWRSFRPTTSREGAASACAWARAGGSTKGTVT